MIRFHLIRPVRIGTGWYCAGCGATWPVLPPVTERTGCPARKGAAT
jgi:hypothetical protein